MITDTCGGYDEGVRATIAVTVAAAAAGCGRIGFDPRDGSAAQRECWPVWRARTVAFDPPRRMGEFDHFDLQGDASLSEDDTRLYFRRENGATGFDVMTATRAQPGDTWSAPSVVPELQTTQDETRFTVAGDGLSAILASNRTGTLGGFDFWLAERASPTDAFDAPTPALLGQVNGPLDQYDPELMLDGRGLYLAPDDGTGMQRIARAGRASLSDPFGAPAFLLELPVSADPTVSPDELVLVFSNPLDGDMYYTTRETTADPFDAVVPVPDLNSAILDNDPELSLDGCELYFKSPRETLSDLQVATVR